MASPSPWPANWGRHSSPQPQLARPKQRESSEEKQGVADHEGT